MRRITTVRLGPACWLVLLVLIAPAARGASVVVPTDQPTIQQGIDAASPGDTVLIEPGTYTGALNKNLDFGGKAITVCSRSRTATAVIDCQDDGRGFHFHTGEGPDSILRNVTIQNGYLATGSGGGIYIESASPTVRNSIVRSCQAPSGYGGGLYLEGSSSRIEGCVVEGNAAMLASGIDVWQGAPVIDGCRILGNAQPVSGMVGGILCGESSATISNCLIQGNNNHHEFTAHGLEINYCSDLIVVDCIFRENGITSDDIASAGGIGMSYSDGCMVVGCSILDNVCDQGAGGIVLDENTDVLIAGCEIRGNQAERNPGGGICIYSGSATVTNCLIAGNSSTGMVLDGAGAGIHVSSLATATITDCTLAGNDAGLGGHGGGIDSGSTAVTLTDSIVWGNIPDQLFGTVTASTCDVQGGWPGGNLDVDPEFASAPWGEYLLSHVAAGQAADSPCIDAGSGPASGITYSDGQGGIVTLADLSTRTDGVPDAGTVDLGYHQEEVREVPSTTPLGLGLAALVLGLALRRRQV